LNKIIHWESLALFRTGEKQFLNPFTTAASAAYTSSIKHLSATTLDDSTIDMAKP
jgi:hypothetical protein